MSEAQQAIFYPEKYSNLIIDTVVNIEEGKYYLVNATNLHIIPFSVVKRISNDFLIVKGSSMSDVKNKEVKYLLNNTFKLSTKLISKNISNTEKYNFSVKYSPGADINFLYDNKEIVVIRNMTAASIVVIRTKFSLIKGLIDNPNIEFVDIVNSDPKEESPIRQYNPEISRINKAKHNYPNLKGEGMVISLKENSVDEGDIDLKNRVVIDESSSEEFTQHAKEMGTLIAGAGNSFKTGEGVVNGATIICTNFNSLFAEEKSYYDSNNIKVQNHSYGTGIENFYSNESISYDQIAVDIPELVSVFSAGNAGAIAPEFGTYNGLTGFANLTGTFKQAKNVLVIAALDSTMNHESLTSSGPAYDGRIKPELAVYGGEGTSESAALVSGSVAMLQNHYLNINGNLPTSSMVKSVFIAGANEADILGIDFKTGYGSVNLNQSLQLLDSGWYREASVGSNDNYNFQIEVPENSAELKVVVSWIDPPANPEDATALINDLDMMITTPSNTQWMPWVLNTSPEANALAAPATRGEDHLNNTEMISLSNPESGLHLISINSGLLQNTNQTFSIAYNIKSQNSFEWSFPLASDHLEANTNPFFRWENTYTSQNSDLLIKYGEGEWELLSQVDISQEQFQYTLKDTTVFALLKVEVGGMEYVTDTFTISQPLEINVENDCSTEFTLSWDKYENTESYVLYELQDKELVPVLSTNDTLVKLQKTTFTENYYAVRPLQSENLQGLRSFAVNYEDRNQGCYLTNFLAFLNIDGSATIQLSVNVPFDIERVEILKEFDGIQNSFHEFVPGKETSFEFQDIDLRPGRYTYQAQLKLASGEIILSDALSLFYTDKSTVIAFPNPVINDDFINILNDYIGGILQLVDNRGNFIKDYDLVSAVEELDLTGINKGTYHYRIIHEERIVDTGRIIRL